MLEGSQSSGLFSNDAKLHLRKGLINVILRPLTLTVGKHYSKLKKALPNAFPKCQIHKHGKQWIKFSYLQLASKSKINIQVVDMPLLIQLWVEGGKTLLGTLGKVGMLNGGV